MPKISVIVPVYKVEAYLQECVDSILAQTFEDFELILVDDGSPDNCGAICDAYAGKDSRVKVIHQENQGLSGARNTGIEASKGEFLTFVDSDDMVSPQYLEVLINLFCDNTDVAVCGFKSFLDGTEYPIGRSAREMVRVYSPKESLIELYNGNTLIPVNACAKLIRRSLLGDLRFPVGKLHEDQAFTP